MQALSMAAQVVVDGKALIAAVGMQRKRMKQRLPLQGVVVDPKSFVPFDVRTARLLGTPVPQFPTC